MKESLLLQKRQKDKVMITIRAAGYTSGEDIRRLRVLCPHDSRRLPNLTALGFHLYNYEFRRFRGGFSRL